MRGIGTNGIGQRVLNPVTLVTPAVWRAAAKSASSTIEEDVMFQAGSLKAAVAALCLAWTRYLLKLAIADVAAQSDRDWQLAELERAEFLAGLNALLGATQGTSFVPTGLGTRHVIGCR